MEKLKIINKFYLDKEKDIIVNLYQTNEDELTYILETPNHNTGNLITNLAKICKQETTKKETSTKKGTTSTKNESANTNNNTSNNNTSNTAKQEQPTNSEPKVEETQPQEQPTTSNKYTPEEAIAYYRSQIEAQGMQWDPSIKDVVSWGTGWIPLSKDELNSDYIANTMAGYNYGSGDGTPHRTYYLEVTGSDENYVYVTGWVCE